MTYKYFAVLVGAAIFLTNVTQTLAGLPPDEILRARTLEEFKAAQEALKMKSKTPRHRRTSDMELSEPIVAALFGGAAGFYHGVASGDPQSDRVILWTRYTPVASGESINLQLRVEEVDPDIPFESHLDPDANKHIKIAKIEISAASDYVAKVDVLGLKSNTHYVFAFTDGSVASEVGQTRTAPSIEDGVEEMTYAFFSCAHFSNGYFHSYDVASTIENLDFWIHVGDYIYEYGSYLTFATSLPDRRDMIFVSNECLFCRLRTYTHIALLY